MRFRSPLWVVLGIAVVLAVFFSGSVGGRMNNELQDNEVTNSAYHYFVSKYYSLTTCGNNESFKSYGILSNGQQCESTEDCKTFWPAGPSYEAMARSFCCSSGAGEGECGEVLK